jgi:hypothetical protein
MSSYVQRLIASAACATALFTATAAYADCGACGSSTQPGLLSSLFGASVGCAPCPASSGDYMVNQGPVYSGPAVIAPIPTYTPTPTASGYPYVSAQNEGEPSGYQANGYQPSSRYRVSRVTPAHRTVYRRAPARRMVAMRKGGPAKKGTQFIRARAEVRIYSPQRMDIRLYR